MSQLVLSERVPIAHAWLARLRQLLPVQPNEVFPSNNLLDHIPSLITEIAAYLRAPEEEEIAANPAVIDKARELGILRHEQKASIHQVLREYEILGELLESFVVTETERLGLQPTAAEGFELFRRLTRSIRMLLRTTVETFIGQYTATIQERNERIRAFNRMASHELRSPLGTLTFAATLLNTDVVQSDSQRLTKVAMVVRSNVDRLSWLVANMQRLARLDDSPDLPSQQHVELSTIATEVVRQVDEMAAAKGVTIRVAPGLPAVLTDPARVELVLLNLVSNAILGGGKPMARKARRERRNLPERSAKLQRVVNVVLGNPSVTLRVETLGAWLNVQLDAAPRILIAMVSAGLLRERQRGLFVARSPCLS